MEKLFSLKENIEIGDLDDHTQNKNKFFFFLLQNTRAQHISNTSKAKAYTRRFSLSLDLFSANLGTYLPAYISLDIKFCSVIGIFLEEKKKNLFVLQGVFKCISL